jgi:hypothetical protein
LLVDVLGKAVDAVEAGIAARTGLKVGGMELIEEIPLIIIVFPPRSVCGVVEMDHLLFRSSADAPRTLGQK